jgi:hypothetical protein
MNQVADHHPPDDDSMAAALAQAEFLMLQASRQALFVTRLVLMLAMWISLLHGRHHLPLAAAAGHNAAADSDSDEEEQSSNAPYYSMD